MGYTFSVLNGMLIGIMITINGFLTLGYGVYSAGVIIHIAGLIVVSIVMTARREWRRPQKGVPLVYYLGGAIGVVTTVANNLAFGHLSVSALMALGLLGQSITSALTDQFGWFGMPRRRFAPQKVFGLCIAGLGVVAMLVDSNWQNPTPALVVAVLVSLLAGVTVVVSRVINARLAQTTSLWNSTFFNYAVGLPVMTLVMLLVREPLGLFSTPALPFWMYLGGPIGVVMVFLSSYVMEKISSLYVTLLMFVGQVLAGILIDAVMDGAFSWSLTLGGALVAAGLIFNLLVDAKTEKNPGGA